MSDRVLDLIDNVIEAYETADAMRWAPDAPDPTPARGFRADHVWIDEVYHFDATPFVERMTLVLDNTQSAFERILAPLQTVTVQLRGFFATMDDLMLRGNVYRQPSKRVRSPKLRRASARKWRQR